MPCLNSLCGWLGRMVPTNIDIPEWAEPFYTEEGRSYRYLCAYGGRAGGKDYAFCQMALIRAMTEPNKRIYILREYQTSIKDSVKTLLESLIPVLGWDDHFTCLQQETRCDRTGSVILYKGLEANRRSIKSAEIDYAWVHEAEALSDESWTILVPTVRRPDSQLWITFNPRFSTDIISREFLEDPRPDALIIKVGFADNPWFPPEMEGERLLCLEREPHRYNQIWLGGYETQGLNAVFPDHIFERCLIPRQPEIPTEFAGVDVAYSDEVNKGDYTAVVGITVNGVVALADRTRLGDTRAKCQWIYGNIKSARGAFIDATMETETGRLLREEWGFSRVTDYRYTLRSKNALLENCLEMLSTGKVRIPETHLDLIDEMRYFCRDEKGRLAGSAARHDDLVNALMLACWSVKSTPAPLQVYIGGSDGF